VKSLKIASAIALSSLLVACGGGGGGNETTGGNNATSSTTFVSGIIKGLDTRLVTANNNLTITPSVVAEAPAMSSVLSLDSFTIDDASGRNYASYAYTGAGSSITSATWFTSTANNGDTRFDLGGTSWSYARFGLFRNAPGPLSDYTWRATPFYVANVSSDAVLTDATYVSGGLSAGIFATEMQFTKINCSASASYNNLTKSVTISLATCTYPDPSNNLNTLNATVTGTVALNSTGSSATNLVVATAIETFTAAQVTSSSFKFGGPNGEELVGIATLSGTGSTNNSGYFTFVFGAKK
jgi:hypothetical protein